MFEHDAKLTRWSADHDGVVSLRAAADLGVDEDAVRRRARAGLLVREHAGIYRHVGTPASFETALRAAVDAAGGLGYVSGPSLMRLYGTRGEWTDRPELTLVGTEHLELPGVRIRRIDRLERRDVGRRAGLPTLSPPLGLLLLGASASAWKVSTAVHDMVFQGFTTRPRLVDVLARYGGRGRRGTTAFRKAVKSLDPNGRATQTNLELKLLAAIQAAGLPPPLVQHVVVDGDGRKRRLDLAWPAKQLDCETDGDRWHLNPADRADMATRDAALAKAGWRTERVGAGEVDTSLPAVLARLAAYW
jgi:hypothetical protein